MELKTFFIIYEKFFKWQKENITAVTLKQASVIFR